MKKKSSKHHQYLADLGGKHKYATRHLAALNFLQSISMKNESAIVENGFENMNRTESFQRISSKYSFAIKSDISQSERIDDPPNGTPNEEVNQGSGRKLSGPFAPTLRIPPTLRYRMFRHTEQSAVIRQWEDNHLVGTSRQNDTKGPGTTFSAQSLLSSRHYYSRARAYPMVVMSIIPYAPDAEKAKLRKLLTEDSRSVYKEEQRDWRGNSYRKWFKESIIKNKYGDVDENDSTETGGGGGGDKGLWTSYRFDPNTLDDPDMLQGKHRYVLRGGDIGAPVMSSVILYYSYKDLKDNLNQQFREKHPTLPPSLTLSKIRKIKKTVLLECLEIDIDVSTVAIACIYFEQVCLKGLVTKANRRLSMAVYLLLALKFNEESLIVEGAEERGGTGTGAAVNVERVPSVTVTERPKLEAVFEFFDKKWGIPKRDVLEAEFAAFVHLEFSLHLPHQHIFVMYTRLLSLIHKIPRSYLGEETLNDYTQSIVLLEREKEKIRRGLNHDE